MDEGSKADSRWTTGLVLWMPQRQQSHNISWTAEDVPIEVPGVQAYSTVLREAGSKSRTKTSGENERDYQELGMVGIAMERYERVYD